jgi:cytochrome c-type biogenesis protein CcmE
LERLSKKQEHLSMAQAAWEKPAGAAPSAAARPSSERLKFLAGGLLLLGAVLYLVASGTLLGAKFFISVDELVNDAQYAGQPVRVAGVVLGGTINIDEANPQQTVITFTVNHYPQEFDVLADALHEGAEDPNATQLQVRVIGQPKPELLRHEAQAIMTGVLGADGVFEVSELNLACPSRFDAGAPKLGEQDHPGMLLDAG